MIDEVSDKEDENWCNVQRQQVIAYLAEEGFHTPTVSERPAWHVAPIISVWAVASKKNRDNVGWWVVAGDFPTDYTTCHGERHPRQALRDIGLRWRAAAANWVAGKPAESLRFSIPGQEKELAPLLGARAELFLNIAQDDNNWDE